MKINGIEINEAVFFATHENISVFYILESYEEQKEASKHSYEILPIEILPNIWKKNTTKYKTIRYWKHKMREPIHPSIDEEPVFEGFASPEEIEWKAYLRYLVTWTVEYKSMEFYSLSPLCFDDWRLEQEDKK